MRIAVHDGRLTALTEGGYDLADLMVGVHGS